MWICRERKREKTNTEATGRLAQIWPKQTVTETERATVSGLVFLIEGRRGFLWSEMDSSGGPECEYERWDVSAMLCAWECLCVWGFVLFFCWCWTTFTPFQSVCPADERRKRQTDSSEGSQADTGQRLEASQLKQSRPDERTVCESAWLVIDGAGDWAVFTALPALSALPQSPLAAAPKTQDSS